MIHGWERSRDARRESVFAFEFKAVFCFSTCPVRGSAPSASSTKERTGMSSGDSEDCSSSRGLCLKVTHIYISNAHRTEKTLCALLLWAWNVLEMAQLWPLPNPMEWYRLHCDTSLLTRAHSPEIHFWAEERKMHKRHWRITTTTISTLDIEIAAPLLQLPLWKKQWNKCMKKHFNYFYSAYLSTLDGDSRMNTIAWLVLTKLLHAK